MKRKIVMNVPMHNDQAKSKAMKIAVSVNGVNEVSVGGDDQLVVIGEDVDSVCLANSLRKKFCFANVVSVEEVKPKPPTPPPSPTKCTCPSCCVYPLPPSPTPCPPYCMYPTPAYYDRGYYDEGPSNCSIS